MPGFEIFGEEEKKEIADVLDTGVLFRYEFAEQRKGVYKVREFEEKFAKYTGTSHAQAVTSGTAALIVALKALGIGAGDEVITQGFTFVATWEAILEVGAIPVFAEIDETLNMSPEDLAKKITNKTKCVIPVHMMGAPAKVQEIIAVCDRHNIPVIEDTAQAAGARIDGRHLGSFGKCGTFSLDSVKTITTGEGGMIITNDAELWRTMSEYHDHGHDHANNPGGRGADSRRFFGANYRMMELQGAIGLAQLAKLDTIIATQQKNKNLLKEAVQVLPNVRFREIVDLQGDSATFLAFMLEDQKQCQQVETILAKNGCGAINFSNNTWHYYTQWEHLLEGKTVTASSSPFTCGTDERKRIIYDSNALPKSTALLERTLVYPINLKMDKQLKEIATALKKAA